MLRAPEERRRDGINPTVVIAVIVGIIALIFILSNLGAVSINFLFIHFRWPAWLMFALMIGVGILARPGVPVVVGAAQGGPDAAAATAGLTPGGSA